ILATWTTNVSNAYSGGLSLSVLLGQDEKKSQLTTAISGIIGTVLAAVGLLNSIQGFLSLLSAIVPALIGTMVADYWIIEGKVGALPGAERLLRPGPDLLPAGGAGGLCDRRNLCLDSGPGVSEHSVLHRPH